MRYIIALGVLAVTLTLSQLGGVAQKPASAPVQPAVNQQQPIPTGQLEQQFIKLEQDWMNAMRKQDGRALELLMAPSFVYTTSVIPGVRLNRGQFIEAATQLTSSLGSFSLDQVAVRLVGDVAVINAIYSQKSQQGEINFSGDYFLTDIWVKQDNRWQVSARNLIRTQKEAPAQNRVASDDQAPKPLSPCQKGCREQFDAAAGQCKVKSADGEPDSYELNIPCMQTAQRVLKACNGSCQTPNQAKRPARRTSEP
jgi:ketosteroid isomerase-like protein